MNGNGSEPAMNGDQPVSSTGRPQCGAKTRSGGRCKRGAGAGTDHVGVGSCKHHGGSTPSGRAAAQKQIAMREVETYGLPVDIDPHTALLEELHRTAGHVAWLNDKVRSLKDDELNEDGRVKRAGNMIGPVGGAQGGFPEWKPSVWIAMYRDERKHLADVAQACIKAGIEERRVRVAEQTGQLFATVIKGILEDLGVVDDPNVGTIVRKHLMTMSNGQEVLAA